MADNVTTSVGPFATDEIGGIHWQRIKVTFGPDGTAGDVTTSNRLPVDVGASLAVTGTFWQATQPISAVALPLPAGAATQATLATLAASAAAAEPAATAGAVVASDSTVLSMRSLWVGGAGNVVATIGGVDVTFTAVAAGTLLPIKATKVKATGTTATAMVWLG